MVLHSKGFLSKDWFFTSKYVVVEINPFETNFESRSDKQSLLLLVPN